MEEKEERLKSFLRDNFSDYEIRFADKSIYDEHLVRIYIKKDGVEKSFFYNYNLEAVVSNLVDGVYSITLPSGNVFTLHSFIIDGKVRMFLSITNLEYGKVMPVGYDINKKNFVIFLMNNKGLIKEDNLKSYLESEEVNIGIDPLLYKNNLRLGNIYLILKNAKVDDEFKVIEKLEKMNDTFINELTNLTISRRKIK